MPKFSTPEYAPLPPYDILTPTEIAAFLRVSNETVYKLIHSRELPAATVRGQYRVLREDFDAWYARAFPSPAPATHQTKQPALFARSK